MRYILDNAYIKIPIFIELSSVNKTYYLVTGQIYYIFCSMFVIVTICRPISIGNVIWAAIICVSGVAFSTTYLAYRRV
jgi:hypothetical protein